VHYKIASFILVITYDDNNVVKIQREIKPFNFQPLWYVRRHCMFHI